MEDWPIVFGVGVGPLKFGLTPSEVAAIGGPIGAPDATDPQPDGTVKEFRDISVPICTYDGGRLAEVQVDEHCRNVTIFGGPLFDLGALELMRRLEQGGSNALFGFETVVFPALGITLADFVVRDLDAGVGFREATAEDGLIRVVTVAKAGSWDGMLGDYEPISFLDE